MKKYFIKKNSIMHIFITIIKIVLLITSIITISLECEKVVYNIVIKSITIIAIILMVLLEKIKIK